MVINFVPQIGIVENNSIIYDGELLMPKNQVGDCSVLTCVGDVKFKIDHNNGKIVGIEGRLGRLEDLNKGDVVLSQFIDGEVYAASNVKFFEGANYFINIPDNVVYDEATGLIVIGDVCKQPFVVRITENMYIVFDFDKISAILLSI